MSRTCAEISAELETVRLLPGTGNRVRYAELIAELHAVHDAEVAARRSRYAPEERARIAEEARASVSRLVDEWLQLREDVSRGPA